MSEKHVVKRGIPRLYAAFFHSLSGLGFALSRETSFRQEFCAFVVLLIPLYFLPLSFAFKCLLFFSHTVVLIVELINSAIESIVDLASPDHHPLAGRAKDLGSAAVLLSLVLVILLWGGAVYSMLYGTRGL